MTYYFVLPFKDRNGKYQTALDNFIAPFCEYIKNNINNYEIIIIEQSGGQTYNGGEELFNLGRTINIGYDILKNKINQDDAFIFHPVDILPIDTDYNIVCTTKFCCTTHSASGEYYKGLGFIVKDFIAVNGFNNDMWGWGGEDDEMKKRLNLHNILVDTNINQYKLLCDDGNGTVATGHYMPTHSLNLNKLNDINTPDDCFKSGLNTLEYKIIKQDIYKGLKKYIII